MHPFEKDSTRRSAGVYPQMDLRLKVGWRFNKRRRALVDGDGKQVSLKGLLPSGTKVLPMSPTLADADPSKLSRNEQLLARYLQVVLPPEADAVDLASSLRELDGVDQVSNSPQVALP